MGVDWWTLIISIHAPPRGATQIAFLRSSASTHFNSRPSARGDECLCDAYPNSALFQFTPLREGRRDYGIRVGGAFSFQFTPLREGRRNQRQDGGALEYFNSRPSARGDAIQQRAGRAGVRISIHAPPRGATPCCWRLSTRWTNFNSRPSARGDGVAVKRTLLPLAFQFTPLREGRPNQKFRAISESISIHAPPRGATRRWRRSTSLWRFQFTPLREGRPKKFRPAP